jgi:hypothetical protein
MREMLFSQTCRSMRFSLSLHKDDDPDVLRGQAMSYGMLPVRSWTVIQRPIFPRRRAGQPARSCTEHVK